MDIFVSEEKLSAISLLSVMSVVGLSHMAFIEVCLLYAQFVESSYHKRMLNFVHFSYICWDDHMIFILY